MHRISSAERRRRLIVRHHLAPDARADATETVARSLVGLHSSDPTTVFLATRARLTDPGIDRIERALYEDGSLLRLHGMRGTMFVEPIDIAVVVQAAAGRALAVAQRRRVERMVADAGLADDPAAWLADVEAATLLALEARGEASAAELGRDEPRLRIQVPISVGKPYEATVGVSTRLLFLLATEGRVVRGRPLGTWISSQYRWRPVTAVLTDGFPDLPSHDARRELVRRWLGAHGPGTMHDLRWWTGFSATHVKRALAELRTEEVALEDGTGWVLPGDAEETRSVDGTGAASFLPSLDPTVMGWADRGFYLGGHGPGLFDGNGNAGPTVWWDGRVVGGWAQRNDGEIAWRLLEDVGADAIAALEAEAERLGRWFGGTHVTPRFRTPLERALTG